MYLNTYHIHQTVYKFEGPRLLKGKITYISSGRFIEVCWEHSSYFESFPSILFDSEHKVPFYTEKPKELSKEDMILRKIQILEEKFRNRKKK